MSAYSESTCVKFSSFELDRDQAELRKNGVAVRVEPQVFDLLWFLVSRAGTIVSRDDIIREVWNDRIVSDSVISTRINAVRRALDDDGHNQRFIKTVPRRGYTFVGSSSEPFSATQRRPEAKPCIAVMPLKNLSDDIEQTYFSDGVTADIITQLCRYPELAVIGRNSSFAYRTGKFNPGQIRDDLSADFVLVGSIRRSEARIRLSVQLIDTGSEQTIWTDQFDRNLSDVFELQDELSGIVVNTLVGRVARQQVRASVGQHSDSIDAYCHVLRATEYLQTVGRNANENAKQEAAAALELAPNYSRAHAIAAWTHVTDGSNQWVTDVQKSFDLAFDHAVKAVACDDLDPWAHCALGWGLIWRDQDHASGIASLERALSLNPSNAQFLAMLSWGLAWAGDHEQALQRIDEAMRLNPHYPFLYLIFRARALFGLKRYEEALVDIERHVLSSPDHSNALILLSACRHAAGHLESAMEAIGKLNVAGGVASLKSIRSLLPYKKDSDLRQVLDALEAGGIRE